jgi:hypothetical protein
MIYFIVGTITATTVLYLMWWVGAHTDGSDPRGD